ncbi:hypothetical protein Tco_0661977 [Tanacetum coccineum]
MSSATSVVTYTSVYTDSEPDRAFWGADDEEIYKLTNQLIYPEYIPLEDEHKFPAEEQPLPPVDSLAAESPRYVTDTGSHGADEEISDGGIPRVIVYGYDGIPINPVAPPSPDYIPDPEEPQTPPVPQDKDEREPMFIQAHDPDYVPDPLPGYVAESDPKEDPEEYEDDETEDGPVDYPIDRGDDEDDDDGDSFGDDADDKDEDDDDEEEEEHLASARPTGEAVSEIVPMTVGEVNTRVTELAELHERDTQDLYALLEDAQDGRTRIS